MRVTQMVFMIGISLASVAASANADSAAAGSSRRAAIKQRLDSARNQNSGNRSYLYNAKQFQLSSGKLLRISGDKNVLTVHGEEKSSSGGIISISLLKAKDRAVARTALKPYVTPTTKIEFDKVSTEAVIDAVDPNKRMMKSLMK